MEDVIIHALELCVWNTHRDSVLYEGAPFDFRGGCSVRKTAERR